MPRCSSTPVQRDPPAVRLRLLVVLGLGQTQGEERRQFHRLFRARTGEEARRHGADGVVCGHIHHPTIRDINGVTYVNTGDFVESCSLVVEHDDGRLEVLRWPKPCARRSAVAQGAAGAEPTRRRRSGLMRILVATDAWRPQVNGVVRSLERCQPRRAISAEFIF